MANGRTTIKELARRSGVSVGTVSRALNGYDDVSPQTRQRIIELANELDYTPAAAARTLVTQRSHVIGVFLDTGEGHPDLQHPFFHEVLVGLKDELGRAGYDLLLFASERQPAGYLSRCRTHHVDGAVVMGIDPGDPELGRLTRSDVPCVGVDVELSGPKTSFVMSDNVEGARLATQHLVDLGHRRIATICGLLDTRPGLDRLRGYRDALQANGLAYRDEYVKNGDFYVESGEREAGKLLDLPEPPTAIVAAADLMALGALRAAAARGLRVPEDVSVVGFDDIMLAAHLRPGLTTVRQDKAGLGAAAGREVLTHVGDRGEGDGDATTLPVALVVRGTTGPVPTT